MKAIKLGAVIDERYELHLKLPEGRKVGPAEVIENGLKILSISESHIEQLGSFRVTSSRAV